MSSENTIVKSLQDHIKMLQSERNNLSQVVNTIFNDFINVRGQVVFAQQKISELESEINILKNSPLPPPVKEIKKRKPRTLKAVSSVEIQQSNVA